MNTTTAPKPPPGLDAAALFPGESVLLVKEVAKALKIDHRHVIELIKAGHLRALNIARAESRAAYRIPASAFDCYVAEIYAEVA